MGRQEYISRTFLVALVLFAATGFLLNNAYAGPSINTFVADDPDNTDNVYSNGDTLTITLTSAGNVTTVISVPQADILANFTFSPSISDATFTGEWADTSTLLITLTSIGTNTLQVGTSTVDVNGATNDIGDPNPNDGTGMIAGSATLSGDFGVVIALDTDGGGSGCSVDCTEPTLGVDDNGKRRVENGFTYNGKPVDVERFFTPYPLITVDVGAKNLAEFKIYENRGPSDIRHFDLAFGLASGQILSQSKAMIEWDRAFDGTESINVIDPDNILSDSVKVRTSEGKCRDDSLVNDCLVVKVFHTFRAPPEFNIVGTNVWDSQEFMAELLQSRNQGTRRINESAKRTRRNPSWQNNYSD